MTINDDTGRFVGATEDEILTILMANAKAEWGDDLSDGQLANVRTFYRPVAQLHADVQSDLSGTLDAAQLDFAEGTALDLLTAKIGVFRSPAVAATGEATFSRGSSADVDYTIPKGTRLQLDSINPVRFETSEKATLTAGTSEVTGVPIRAIEPGTNGNLGANTLTVMPDAPTGIEDVTNPAQTTGGENREDDEHLRDRAHTELSDGMRATAIAVRNRLLKVADVLSVSPFINDSADADGEGREGNSVEYVVQGGLDSDVGQRLFESKAAAGGTDSGIRGTSVTVQAAIGNGQTHPVEFSRPTEILVYVDMDLSTTSEYGGDDAVQNAIIEYLGGVRVDGTDDDGRLLAGDDVIYTKIMGAILSVDGVADVPSLTIGKSASPTGTSNISIALAEVATGDATDGSITITEV